MVLYLDVARAAAQVAGSVTVARVEVLAVRLALCITADDAGLGRGAGGGRIRMGCRGSAELLAADAAEGEVGTGSIDLGVTVLLAFGELLHGRRVAHKVEAGGESPKRKRKK